MLHKTHMPLRQWFLAFYLVCQDKRGISAVQLSSQLGTTYKTAWYMLKRIRAAMGQRDKSTNSAVFSNLTIPTLVGLRWGKNGGVAQKKQRFLWHYP